MGLLADVAASLTSLTDVNGVLLLAGSCMQERYDDGFQLLNDVLHQPLKDRTVPTRFEVVVVVLQ